MNDKSESKVNSRTFNFDDDDYNSQPSYEDESFTSSNYDSRDQQIDAIIFGYDSSELHVENEMSIMMTRDDYGFPFYESMGDLSFQDNREGFSPDDYTTGNWKKEQAYRTCHGPYTGPPETEWSQKTSLDSTSTQQHMELNYLMGSDGVQHIRYSDLMHLELKEPQQRFETLCKVHRELILSYEGIDCKGRHYYGPRMNLIMRQDVAEKIVERLPITCNSCQVQLWYWKLSMFLVHYKYNIALIPFEYIDMNLGAVGICLPGVGRKRYDEMGKALATLLTCKLLPTNRTTGLEKCTYNETLDMVRRNKSKINGYEILYSLLSELRFKV